MRMWGVNPKLLCQRHLLGEHVEMHMFVGTLQKKISVEGYTSTGLVDLTKLRSRHAELMLEMRNRRMNHKSPLPALPRRLPKHTGTIDVQRNLEELKRRCPDCRARITQSV